MEQDTIRRNVPDAMDSSVLKLASGATTTTKVTFPGLQPALQPICGVAVDRTGNLYVTDCVKNEENRVLRLAPGANSPTVLPLSGLLPLGVVVDSVGNLYVADARGNQVLELPVELTSK